jgi:hypothetical protein
MGALCQRAVKPLIDTAMENVAGHFTPCAAIEPESLGLSTFLRDLLLTHPLLETDWTMVGPKVDRIEEEELNTQGI